MQNKVGHVRKEGSVRVGQDVADGGADVQDVVLSSFIADFLKLLQIFVGCCAHVDFSCRVHLSHVQNTSFSSQLINERCTLT